MHTVYVKFGWYVVRLNDDFVNETKRDEGEKTVVKVQLVIKVGVYCSMGERGYP